MWGTPHRSRRISTGSQSPGSWTSPSAGGSAALAASLIDSIIGFVTDLLPGKGPTTVRPAPGDGKAACPRPRGFGIMGFTEEPKGVPAMAERPRPWLASYPPDVPHSLAPYPEKPLWALLEESAERFPDSTAVAFPVAPMARRLSYRQL